MNMLNKQLLALLTILAPLPALASEGGSSVYLQGAYGDFQAAAFGPAGVYLRNDLMYYEGEIGPRPLGGRVAAGSSQQFWANILHLAWLSEHEILGARYGAAIALPVIQADVEGHVSSAGPALFREGDVSGQGDVFLSPLLLNWKLGNHDLTFAPGINIPVGKYEEDRLLNTGRHYWAFDLAGAWTWLQPTRGQEISITSGVLFNRENPATDYRTGNEFHLDALLGQYFSASFGVGLVGYYYKQLSEDDGTLIGPLSAENFQGEGYGLGPAALYNFKAGDTSVSLIGKALFDIHSENRFDGDTYMLSLAFKL